MSYLNDAIWNIKECFPDLRYEVVYDDILTALAKAVLAKLEKRADVDAFLQVVRDQPNEIPTCRLSWRHLDLLESGWQNLVQSGGLRHDPKDLPFVPYLKALHMLASAAKGKDMKLFAEFQRLLPQL